MKFNGYRLPRKTQRQSQLQPNPFAMRALLAQGLKAMFYSRSLGFEQLMFQLCREGIRLPRIRSMFF